MPNPKNTEAMRKLVADFHNSGQSQKAFAAMHGLSKGKLHYWIKKLAKPSTKNKAVACSSFIPLEVVPAASPCANGIIIRTSNGVEIEIPL